MSLFGDGICIGMQLNQLTALSDLGVKGTHRHWLFRCTCGKEISLRAEAVKRGNNVCCGSLCCLLRHKTVRCLDPEKGARNYVLRYYKSSAKVRGRCFELTDQDCLLLFKSPCVYCGAMPSAISRPRKTRAAYIYSGIDRLDNDLGYTKDNCVSCCKTCNIMKQSLSVKDFTDHITKMFLHLKTPQPYFY